MELEYTKHAQHRMKNRAIGDYLAKVVFHFGRERTHGGLSIVEIAKKDLPYVIKDLGIPPELTKKLGRIRIVVSGWTVVTAMHRT